MISENRKETCVDDESSLQKAELSYMSDDESEKILKCEVGRAKGLCNEKDQLDEGIHIDDETLNTFQALCKLTCDKCTPKDIDYYMVTVNTEEASFVEQNGVGIPVTVTIKAGASDIEDTYTLDSRGKFSFGKEKKFHCGDRIQFAATPQQAHGVVICEMRMVDQDTSDARMMESSGEVIIGGDIEVTFECHTPAPTSAPTTPVPTTSPTTAPSIATTSAPSIVPPTAPSIATYKYITLTSTGKCPQGKGLTEEECKNLGNGGVFSTWAEAGRWNLPETC